MINLIPKQEKKKIIRNFYYRLVVLFLVILNFSIFIALVAIIPSYFYSSVKNSVVEAKLAAQKQEPVPVPDQETLLAIKDLNHKLDLVETAENNKFTVSARVVNAIILKKMPEIKLTSISYDEDPVKGKSIKLQGIAPSREMLLLFRLALEDDSLFKHVDLPISNFVKGSNIQFSLSLIPS